MSDLAFHPASDSEAPVSKGAIINSTKDAFIILGEIKIAPGETKEFSISPGTKLEYAITINEETVEEAQSNERVVKVKWEDDEDEPELKLDDYFESKEAVYGVETTKVEEETETKTEKTIKTSKKRSAVKNPAQPTKRSEESEKEEKTLLGKKELKKKFELEVKGKSIKKVETVKTEIEEKIVSLTWELYEV